jgi:hypothetical protein
VPVSEKNHTSTNIILLLLLLLLLCIRTTAAAATILILCRVVIIATIPTPEGRARSGPSSGGSDRVPPPQVFIAAFSRYFHTHARTSVNHVLFSHCFTNGRRRVIVRTAHIIRLCATIIAITIIIIIITICICRPASRRRWCRRKS